VKAKNSGLGFSIFLSPFIIASLIASLGFTNHKEIVTINPRFNLSGLYSSLEENREKKANDENPTSTLNLFDLLKASPDSITAQKMDSLVVEQKDTVKAVLSKADSIKFAARQDSIKYVDSLSRDSLARVQQFTASPRTTANIPVRRERVHSFFVDPYKSFIQRNTKLDSTGTKVIISETMNGKSIRPDLVVPLEEYIKLRMAALNRDSWEALAYQYELKSSKKDLAQLITDLTNIDIPLPSSPLLSIFGPPKINLRISGAVDIRGAWRNETTEGITSSALGNTRNEPDFKQQVQINLAGTIGDKLTLSADWNTERQFQYENQLKIQYKGYDDEIIQSIEAGNVSLQASPLVGGSEALFGVKALFKMGPFTLTALASQKKSEVTEVALSGGAKAQKFEVRAYDYSTNHYFIDQIYADRNLNIFNNYFSNPTPFIRDSVRVKDIEVWKSTTGLFNPNERKVNAYIDLPRKLGTAPYSAQLRDSTVQTDPGTVVGNSRFILLTEGVDYTIHKETGFISFITSIQEQDAVAIAVRIEGRTGADADDVYYGEFIKDLNLTQETRLVLKLIKPANLQPQHKKAWKLQLRNIYPIGGRNVKEEGFIFDVMYRVEGQEPQNNYQGIKLLETFGLDRTDKSKTSTQPDGAFDYFPGRTIIPKTGEIIFPVLEPFGKDFPIELPDSLKFQLVYDTTKTFARQDRTKDKFVLNGEYSAEVTSVFQIGFNVVEKSVKVLLNGNQLSEGQDYTVDYNVGQIIIRNDNALVPGADLKISYEQNDLISLASKTMIGLRGLYEFNRNTTLGFSFLNLNQQTLSDKVRIGEEPLNNSIWGTDFKTTLPLPFLTKAIDKLISTSAPSTLTINAEAAYMDPDPNTKKSTIESDGGKSIAFVDDFEGAKRTIPLGMAYGSWKDISVPQKLAPSIDGLPSMRKMDYKGKTFWFNRTPSDVTIKAIYGERKNAAPDQQQITALDMVFDPSRRGFYNYTPNLGNKSVNWGGMMKVLSSSANNLIEENIEFIEFWVNIVEAPENLKLVIDLGQISEDVIPNGVLDTEDKNDNTLVDEGEDTGLDGVRDVGEPGYDSALNPDPANDNYRFNLTQDPDYSNINGTEGNAVSIDLGRFPDSEDLNGNRTLDRVDSYFRYEIPLDSNKFTNPFIQGGGDNAGWYLYRIPLKDFTDKVRDPSFSIVEFIRFWVTGTEQTVHLRFAEMNLVGNQWQKVLTPEVTIDDEVLTLSTINVEDNPDYYSPPGVIRERDRSKPDYQIFKNEQSLELILKNLDDGKIREVVRYLYKSVDLFNYKEMKFFVHGDLQDVPGSVSYYDLGDPNNYGSEVYLRFGSDSTNFYEYRQPVRAGWNEVSMLFSELTSIKQRRSGDSVKVLVQQAVADKAGHFFGVRGNPTLTRVSYFLIGISNPADKGEKTRAVSGSIWLNELRVLDADNTPGWAMSGNASLMFADLLRVSANYTKTDPYFHKLADRFGTRDDRSGWGVSADLDLIKLIPFNLSGSNMRISYSVTEAKTAPQYLPGTDVQLVAAQEALAQSLADEGVPEEEISRQVAAFKRQSETFNRSETWNLSNVRIKLPSSAWYATYLVNNLTFGFNFNRSSGYSPTIIENNAWNWNANAGYSLSLSRDFYFLPADIPLLGEVVKIFQDYKDVKVYFFPQTFNTSITANRKRMYSLNFGASAKPNIQRDFTSSRGAGFNWIITEGGFFNIATNYNFDVQSTYSHLLSQDEQDRSEKEIWNDIIKGSFFGRDFSYKQSLDFRLTPKMPTIFELNRYLTFNAGYSSSYSWQNNFQQENLGRAAGYTNRITSSLTIRLKSIFAPLFESAAQAPAQQVKPQPRQVPTRAGGRRSGARDTQAETQAQPAVADTTKKPVSDSLGIAKSVPDSLRAGEVFDRAGRESLTDTEEDTLAVPTESIFSKSLNVLKLVAKTILFDYDQISVNFSQSSSLSGGGLLGTGTGFANFWGFSQSDENGPSRLFMLGLSNNIGRRAPLGNLSDNYTHKNDLDFKTSRPLWEGAQIDLNWKVGWGFNKATTLQTDSLGNVSVNSLTSTGQLDRSFLSFPSTSLFSFLGTGIKKVNELYDRDSDDPNSSLSESFRSGFEAISILGKVPILKDIMKYIPRPNWSFSWSGLEKFSFLSFAQRITLSHAYTSTYSEGWKVIPDKDRQIDVTEIQSQKVDFSFSPLIGVSITMNNFYGGNFQGAFRYNTRSSYSLGVSTRNITESFSNDISLTASYSKSGFELPLFGISLKNDIEVSFSYTSGKNSSVLYEMDRFDEKGKPLEGKTNTTIEPKIRYVMSSRVTLSIFYRRSTIQPEGASRIPPTKTNEAGVDVRISIQ
jgi:cell surface protein SprA